MLTKAKKIFPLHLYNFKYKTSLIFNYKNDRWFEAVKGGLWEDINAATGHIVSCRINKMNENNFFMIFKKITGNYNILRVEHVKDATDKKLSHAHFFECVT